MKTRIKVGIATALAVMALLAFVPGTSAHGGNHGTIKVHDEMDADPDVRNEPHVSCDFWMEGFNMHDSAGSLVFYEFPPTGGMEEVVPTGDGLVWTGTPEEDGDGHHFLEGPFQLPEGHYRVEAFSNDGHPGGHDHFSKAKMFWVDPCDDTISEECPAVLITATAHDGGSITVNVTTEADFTLVRTQGGDDPEVVGVFSGDTVYEDTDTSVGTTYTYQVVIEDETCARVVVTAIPVFPGAIAAGLAVTLGVLGYAYARRR